MRKENVKLWESSTGPWCGYAGNRILFMPDIATTILVEVFTNFGLCTNVSKTDAMILNHMTLR